jgi:hypothetical protein
MTLEDEIVRVRELLIQRDEIDTELEGLIGGDVQPAGRQPKESVEEIGKKKGNKCGKCGKRGHNAKTCPTAHTNTVQPPAFGDKTKLDEDQFDDLKHRQSIGDLISKDFAADNSLALSEVNRAIASRNFEEYSHF